MRRKTAAQQDREIARRKRLIARMLVRQEATHLSCLEIAERLAYPRTHGGKIDRDRQSVAPNGKPWSKATIARDIAELNDNWQAESYVDAAQWKTRIIAQYQELLEQYWKTGDYEGVGRVLAALCKITGADSDHVAQFEQLQLQLSIALQRLREHYGDNPALLAEIYRVLSGNPKADVDRVPRPLLPKDKN